MSRPRFWVRNWLMIRKRCWNAEMDRDAARADVERLTAQRDAAVLVVRDMISQGGVAADQWADDLLRALGVGE